jgi:hypothetical protein
MLSYHDSNSSDCAPPILLKNTTFIGGTELNKMKKLYTKMNRVEKKKTTSYLHDDSFVVVEEVGKLLDASAHGAQAGVIARIFNAVVDQGRSDQVQLGQVVAADARHAIVIGVQGEAGVRLVVFVVGLPVRVSVDAATIIL